MVLAALESHIGAMIEAFRADVSVQLEGMQTQFDRRMDNLSDALAATRADLSGRMDGLDFKVSRIEHHIGLNGTSPNPKRAPKKSR